MLRICLAFSDGHRNNTSKRFGWCLPIERLSRATIEFDCDLRQLSLGDERKVRCFWKVLAQQPVRIFVRPALHGLCGSQK